MKKPNEDDWDKLTRLVIYIQGSIDLKLRLSLNGMGVSKWWIDASFAIREQGKKGRVRLMDVSQGEKVLFSASPRNRSW